MNRSLALLAPLLAAVISLQSQDIRATTSDGKAVILKSDGTWTYVVAADPAIPKSSELFRRSAEATGVFKTKGERFIVYYDPNKWTQGKVDDVNRVTFTHKDGDVYGVAIIERAKMDLDPLIEMAITNARAISPNAEVISKEFRIVNGTQVLCMRIEGTMKGLDFIYYGYYYAGNAGIVQLLTYTYKNLFPEYRAEMNEFLNGLTIND